MSDSVNHPAHYIVGNIECIDCIRAALGSEQFIGFCKGNVIKYLFRAGRKHADDLEDYRKAEWYIKKLIEEEQELN